MKILHVVTLIAPDGRFGGPTRVAQNLGRQSVLNGHEVTIVAGHTGYEAHPPKGHFGANYVLFPTKKLLPMLGFAALVSPRLWLWLWLNVKKFDVIHVHMGRDIITLVSLLVGRLRRTKIIIQTHGMLAKTDKVLARPLDYFITKPNLRSAATTICLTDIESAEINLFAPGINTVVIPNGIDYAHDLNKIREEDEEESPIVEVLFLARLHERKQPILFVQMALELKTRWPHVKFALVGPDEGEATKISKLLSKPTDSMIHWEGPVDPDRVTERMGKCTIYVLPSLDEPFGLTILEAMSLAKPVVVSETCGLAPDIRKANAGIVYAQSLIELVGAVETLLYSPGLRTQMGLAGASLVKNHFSIANVTDRVENVYAAALSNQFT